MKKMKEGRKRKETIVEKIEEKIGIKINKILIMIVSKLQATRHFLVKTLPLKPSVKE